MLKFYNVYPVAIGSGKQTVVRLAAEDLGVHVVEFNCYDFVGTRDGKTAAALTNAFKSAKRLVKQKRYFLGRCTHLTP